MYNYLPKKEASYLPILTRLRQLLLGAQQEWMPTATATATTILLKSKIVMAVEKVGIILKLAISSAAILFAQTLLYNKLQINLQFNKNVYYSFNRNIYLALLHILGTTLITNYF